jgi:hypothetical protein
VRRSAAEEERRSAAEEGEEMREIKVCRGSARAGEEEEGQHELSEGQHELSEAGRGGEGGGRGGEREGETQGGGRGRGGGGQVRFSADATELDSSVRHSSEAEGTRLSDGVLSASLLYD